MWHSTTEHWHHAAYAHHFGGFHADHGSWLGHSIVSAVIHGLIYGAIFRLFRGIPLGEVLVIAIIGVLVVGGGYWLWNARRN
ncbi:hypothetical protein [Acidithiobacillus ferridurans]|uniref:Uncharacterized protein n=1 Tax=Acidithiobacillus ferridurans TaxID=1232575 RepID=A0A8X8KAS9_ACIFI|nr:hypothetical protein [Acidithiobacillus ferridurans]MBU2716948.1 hypothetical protein [Acidithiobacillus ferridurans]MBU2721794.1 hypothetical protein [Acidithiobacillus ferridurans]MBU2725663.1 hypothetical protein [Acidithiobacillus ferridurans]